jgi:uncharacterized protein YdaU (DUF1376 family)
VNYYEHHLGDYMRVTTHLSIVEDGVYRRLLDAYYIRERALPIDVKECCKLARATSKNEREAVAYVLREFFQLQDDGHHQGRADKEIARLQGKQRKAKASADARWDQYKMQCEVNANAYPDAMRSHSEGNAPRARSQTPDTSNQIQDQNPLASQPVELPPSAPSKRAGRLPDDWVIPITWVEWATAEQPTWSPDHCHQVAASFADYWHAKAGKDAAKLDWEATWRIWVRREGPMRLNGGPRGQHQESERDIRSRARRELLEQINGKSNRGAFSAAIDGEAVRVD